MAESLDDETKRRLAIAGQEAHKRRQHRRAAAQAAVGAALHNGTNIRLDQFDDACSGDPIDDRLKLKGTLLQRGLLTP